MKDETESALSNVNSNGAHPDGRVKALPQNLAVKCPNCREVLVGKDWEKNFHICSKCGYHFRLSAPEVIGGILEGRVLAHRRFQQLLAFGSLAALHFELSKLVTGDYIVWVDFELLLKSRLRKVQFPGLPVFCSQLFAESRLLRGKLDGGLVLGDGLVVAIRFRIGLCQDLMHTPRLGVNLEHFLVAVFGDKQVGPPAMIKNVRIIRREFRSFVQGSNGFFGILGGKLNHTKPHPSIRV